MKAVRVLFSIGLASFALTGCPESTTPADGSNGNDGSDIASPVDASTDLVRACSLYMDYFARCGVADGNCFLEQFNANCTSVLTHYRPELLSYINSCLSTLTCESDAGSPLPMSGTCSPDAVLAAAPSAAQQAAADALCAACPDVATGSTTAAECSAAVFATRDGGASSGAGGFLRYVNDETADWIRSNCPARLTTDGGSCQTSALFCMFDAIGYSPIFAACSADAGTRDP
jgi:hypothetical protein